MVLLSNKLKLSNEHSYQISSSQMHPRACKCGTSTLGSHNNCKRVAWEHAIQMKKVSRIAQMYTIKE